MDSESKPDGQHQPLLSGCIELGCIGLGCLLLTVGGILFVWLI